MCGDTLVLNKDDESELERWELCLHELSLIINEYDSTPDAEFDFESLKHHEDSKPFQNHFSADFFFSVKSINSDKSNQVK